MSTFLYKGMTMEGAKQAGARKANSQEEMEEFVKSLDLIGYEIFTSETPYSRKAYSLVGPRDLSIFCKQMSVMFFSYITLMEGVKMLEEQTDNKTLKITLHEIYDFMEQGYTFSESISMYNHIFGSYLIEMVNIGENSGNLDQVFNDLSIYFEKENTVRRKVKSAVIYPVTLSIIMIGLIVFLVKEILPIFDSMLTSMGGEITSLTKGIIGTSEFLNNYLLSIVLVVVVVVALLVGYFKSEKGSYNYDKLKAKLPGSKYVIYHVVTARFARSLSILLKSGINLVSAIEESIPLIENQYLEEKFYKAYDKVKNGANLADSLEGIGVFPPLFIKMVIIGEKTGNLDQMLSRSADLFESQVDDAIEKTTKIIEPVLITILSIVVGIILLSIMIPMINIMQNI